MASWVELPEDVDTRPGGGDYDGPPRITPDMPEFWDFVECES